MRRLTAVIALCMLTLSAVCQSTNKWQVALITEVKPHQAAGNSSFDPVRYDVSVKVGETIYDVLYTQPLGEIPAKYEIGRELLVLVGNKTITYNDIFGQSLEVPIQRQKPATESKGPK
jgi:hypothetical protein